MVGIRAPVSRIVLYIILLTLAVFVVIATFVLEHGGPSEARAEVSLHDLLLRPEIYTGKTIATRGTLRFSSELGEYELVEGEQSVLIRNHGPGDLSDFTDSTVRVTGRLEFETGTGLLIDAEFVHTLAP